MPKEKNSRFLGDLVGGHSRARDLDHGANLVTSSSTPFSAITFFSGRPEQSFLTYASSLTSPTSGIMISGMDIVAVLLLHFDSSLDNGTGLHLSDFRIA